MRNTDCRIYRFFAISFLLAAYIAGVAAEKCCADKLSDALTIVKRLDIGRDPTWAALLHIVGGECYVTNELFLLSKDECSPDAEIEALLRGLFDSNSDRIENLSCRFPARIAFLASKLKPFGLSLPNKPCGQLVEYESKVSTDKISLVFASENITHPASMLGHVFLKFQGSTGSARNAEHAAAFSARIDDITFPSLFFKSLFIGLPSDFSLTPYSEQLSNYRDIEERNLWEYRVRANDLQRKLMLLHVWELRDINSPYYFVGYNCATVVYFFLSIVNPALLENLRWWISPVDVVRRGIEFQVLDSQEFFPSLDWQIRNFKNDLGSVEVNNIFRVLLDGQASEINSLGDGEHGGLRLAFINALVDHDNYVKRLQDGRLKFLRETLSDSQFANPQQIIFATNIKDPLKAPKSSRWAVAAVRLEHRDFAKFEFLPISHSLTDDNRNSIAETSLELGQAAFLYDWVDERAILEKLNIYAFESFLPFDDVLGGVSHRLSLGIERQWDGQLSGFSAGHLTGGIGRTWAPLEDLRLFATVNSAVNYGDGREYVSYFPEIGLLMYEVFDMKTVSTLREVCGEHGARTCYRHFSVAQSFFLSNDIAPYFRFDRIWSKDHLEYGYEIGMKKYF